MAPSTVSSASATPPPSAPPPFTLFDADLTTARKPFRNPNAKPPSRRVKNAKQIISDESKRLSSITGPGVIDKPTFINVEAPPSVLPRKWWCDITGLRAPYRMPGSGMRYHNKELYEVIKHLPPGVDQQYLQLRSANVVLK
ncbi:hypothetical protein V1525DRAFT_413265 [Lipomyces kononenkoae]|uniref:Uncharacterized protein n=1 Tax=Lipomyces kononenkoae TaxID=34357 RepID=A0ACC3SRX8_LIPKO